MKAVALCKQAGIKVGLRFTLTRDNAAQLPDILDLQEQHSIGKFSTIPAAAAATASGTPGMT